MAPAARPMLAFAEQRSFTAAWAHLGFDLGDLFDLQDAIAADPTAGPVIPGTGRLRKVRFARRGGGKRGGVRVLYAHFPAAGVALLFMVFPKNAADNITAAQANAARKLLDEYAAALR